MRTTRPSHPHLLDHPNNIVEAHKSLSTRTLRRITCFTKHGGLEVKLNAFLTLAQDEDEGTASLQGKQPPVPTWVPEPVWIKKPYPCRESKPGRPARSLVSILTELSRLLDKLDRGG
jgi:hypothetical protein